MVYFPYIPLFYVTTPINTFCLLHVHGSEHRGFALQCFSLLSFLLIFHPYVPFDFILVINVISAPSYTHHVLDDHFPGICFLGKPHEVTVQSDPVTISPPGHGVSLKIPPNAIQSSDKPVNVSLQTCLSSSVFQYPEGCTPLSAVYHISSDMAFDKDVELTFEHFAELETDKQANEMTFLRAEAQGEGKYIFVPMGSGEFKVGGHKCTISTRQFSFVSAGSISSSEIRKIIAILY